MSRRQLSVKVIRMSSRIALPGFASRLHFLKLSVSDTSSVKWTDGVCFIGSTRGLNACGMPTPPWLTFIPDSNDDMEHLHLFSSYYVTVPG